MLTVTLLLVVVAFGLTIASILNPPRCPLWVPVLLLCIIQLMLVIPTR